MFRVHRLALIVIVGALQILFLRSASAQQFSPDLYQELRWRMIGPFRGGRTRAVAGVSTQPNVFYIGAVNGGVWKSDDYGRTWNPIFDGQPSQSIGAKPSGHAKGQNVWPRASPLRPFFLSITEDWLALVAS